MAQLTTKLDAINTMLEVVGLSKVNDYDNTNGNKSANTAKHIFEETNREVQSLQLTFNTFENYDLVPDANKNILIPDNTLRIKSDDGEKYVQKGIKLYDYTNNTFEFENNAVVKMSLLMDYEEIPEVARYYIMVKAARKFQQRILGSETIFGFTRLDEEQAKLNLFDVESDIFDYNIFNNSRINKR